MTRFTIGKAISFGNSNIYRWKAQQMIVITTAHQVWQHYMNIQIMVDGQFSLEEGLYDYKDILAKGIVNDQISSLRVSDGYKVTIYDDEGFKGKSKNLPVMRHMLEMK